MFASETCSSLDTRYRLIISGIFKQQDTKDIAILWKNIYSFKNIAFEQLLLIRKLCASRLRFFNKLVEEIKNGLYLGQW